MPIRTPVIAGVVAAVTLAGAAQAMPTADYLKAAGASDLYEMQASKLVLQSTKDAKLRSFANEMITDHTKSTNMVKAAATKSGLKPGAPMLTPKQHDMIAQLTAAKGEARDTMYVGQQKTAHQEALATQQDYASTGDKPALKMAAGKIVPVVQSHIAMLDKM